MKPSESFVGQPVRSLQTMLRVIFSAQNDIPILIPDGIYGASTMEAVSAIQRQEGLPVTGIVNQETWERIYKRYDISITESSSAEPIEILLEPGQIIRKDEYSPYVYLAQSILTQLSQDHPTITKPTHNGVLDQETSASLLAFQKLSNLKPTGELDRLTWKHMAKQFTLNAHHNFNYQ